MGYTSDVRVVITGPKEAILNEFATLRLTGDEHMHEALDEWRIMENGGDNAVAILGQGGVNWKWYASYPVVQAHEKIWGHFCDVHDETDSDAPTTQFSGAFVRIGEDDNDTETRYLGDGYDLAYPRHLISCDYDDYDKPDIRPRLQKSGG